jgi:tetratricopeptide (TPR) repeat protein
MANLLTDTGRVEQSVPLLREAFATNPNHPELLWELGYAYRSAGMLEQSVAECERARQLDPGVKINSSALNSLLYLGQYDAFLDRLPNTEDVAFISFYRGFAFYHRNERERARANFDHAYQLDPSLLQAQIGKAISFEIAGNTSKGLEMIRRAESRADERGVRDLEAIYKIAQAYSILGDQSSALRMLQRSLENGFFPYEYLVRDPLLRNLSGKPGFDSVMKIAQARQQTFQKKFF